MGIENWILKFADDTKIFSELSEVKDCTINYKKTWSYCINGR